MSRMDTNTEPQAADKDPVDPPTEGDPVNLGEAVAIEEENSTSEGDTISNRLSELQEELLTSLKEDISDWIIKTLGVADISADNFIYALDTGVILCKLSMIIEKKAQECFQQGALKETPPNCKLHCYENAGSGSWYARDNTTNFLKWCRAYGMTDQTLFDSEDLVTHHQERQVIYCLMELARIGSKFGLEPPILITLEKEIDSETTLVAVPSTREVVPVEEVKVETSDTLCIDKPCPLEPPDRIPTISKKPQETTLDTEVYKVSLKCQCEDYVNKISEGVFNVYGKRVFIRLLKGKHLMVRVGGGWDTFENYLLHHDPVEVFTFNHGGQHRSPQNSANNETKMKRPKTAEFLVIRSKYKSNSFHS